MTLEVSFELNVLSALLLKCDFVTWLKCVGRNVDVLAVYQDVAMADELASKSDGVCKANSVYSVVKSFLERDDKICGRVFKRLCSKIKCALDIYL